MSTDIGHPPEPAPEAFAQVRLLLEDLSRQLAAIPEELTERRFDASIHAPIVNWTVYCLLLIGEHCAAAADLASKRHARVLTTLARTTYEYCIAQLYVERNPDIAREQFATFYGRTLRRIVDMHPADEEERKQFEQWNEDAKKNNANSFSGNFNNKAAILSVEGEHRNGISAYGLFYAQMSTFAHPDAAGYDDVFAFDINDEGLSVYFREESSHHAFDALCLIAMHAIRALRAAATQLKLTGIDVNTFAQRERAVSALHFNVE